MTDAGTSRNWPVIGGVTVLALAVVVLALAGLFALTGGSDLEDAATACASEGQPRVGDNGQTLTVTSSGRKQSALNASAVSSCVLAELDAPDSVVGKVVGTTAMMGRQSDTWDDLKITWTYHPDNGLEIVVEAD